MPQRSGRSRRVLSSRVRIVEAKWDMMSYRKNPVSRNRVWEKELYVDKSFRPSGELQGNR